MYVYVLLYVVSSIEDIYTFMYIFHTHILTLCLTCSLAVV